MKKRDFLKTSATALGVALLPKAGWAIQSQKRIRTEDSLTRANNPPLPCPFLE